MNTGNVERRTLQRYSASSFSVQLKSTRSKEEYSNPKQLLLMDFNRFGMAVQSQHNFKIGDELHIVISDGMDSSVEVAGFVCNRCKTADGYRCGLHFLIQEDAISQSLLKMEQQLDGILACS